ncbi:polysaccharide biosynthesis C-terminal domain-containing protein [Ornithinimicrobium faecis]|uniref:oligosaccharide flippase family protein n=1 Tax=Ornithinimicrobium faecis TaxID=2934158 RepID=UPI002118ED2C|nr:polysaccharide biosynthesis C-terminal domain-containing protein [Ornithinimicrobium sp. HY1745]
MTTTPRAANADIRAVARGGAFTLMGSVISAVTGLLFIILIARLLGTAGAGTVLQAIAAFTIAMSIAKMGLDTTAVWLLPRLLDEAPATVRAALVGIMGPSLVLGGALGAGLILGAELITDQEPLQRALRAMGWVMPAASLATVGLAATRGLGGVRTYVSIGSIAIPTLRPALAWVATAMGGGAVAVALSWVLPFPLAALVVVVVLLHQLNRGMTEDSTSQRWWPSRSLTRRTWSFALPRALSTGLEQAMTWLDVLIVGMLAGPTAAGIYGAATRFVSAGVILSTSLRIVVAPMYSRHLASRRIDAAQHLYSLTTKWILLFSLPLYALMALFSGTALSILGPDFRSGAIPLTILACGMALVLAAGNVQSVLLMSGHSSLAAMNKFIAVVLNVSLLVVLVPWVGLVGAAISWTAALAVDTALAVWQVHTRIGLHLGGRDIWRAMAVAILCTVVPGGVTRLLLGDTLVGLVTGICVSALVLGPTMWKMRVGFDLDGLVAMLKSRSGR